MSSDALIILIKNPELGKAKTRIANAVGNEKALEIYKQLLSITRTETLKSSADKKLYYSSFIDNQDNWDTQYFSKKLQSGNNLGSKMYNAFKETLPNYTKVILIGSDLGELNIDILNKAFTELDHHDVVIGPANDGGYYLIGMKKLNPIFTSIEWSTSSVLEGTLKLINNNNLSFSLLETLTDIDHIEDWITLKQKLDLK